QPDMQRELRRLTRGASEDSKPEPRDCGCRKSARDDQLVNLGDVEGATLGPDEQDRGKEPEVADTRDDERLLGRRGRARLVEPEADEQVAAETNELPEH